MRLRGCGCSVGFPLFSMSAVLQKCSVVGGCDIWAKYGQFLLRGTGMCCTRQGAETSSPKRKVSVICDGERRKVLHKRKYGLDQQSMSIILQISLNHYIVPKKLNQYGAIFEKPP